MHHKVSITEARLSDADSCAVAKRITESFCNQGFVLYKLQDTEAFQLNTTQTLLGVAANFKGFREMASKPLNLQSSSQPAGQFRYSFRLGQEGTDNDF